MASFQAISFSLCFGGTISIVAFAAFGAAVRSRSVNIAPRCTARSPDTIYNPRARRGRRSLFLFIKGIIRRFWRRGGNLSSLKKNENEGEDEEDVDAEVQYRGGAMFGWIPWTLSLSYDQMLNGVPGTGTRKDGAEGANLRVNLDGIILLRFHALCLRVSVLATIVALGLVLPLNVTARCLPEPSRNCTRTYYELATIANISTSPKLPLENSLIVRLYMIVGFSWIIAGYTLYLIKKEWVDVLALRRVYYLEGKHWENRQVEMKKTILNHDIRAIDANVNGEERLDSFMRRLHINEPSLRQRKKMNRMKNATENGVAEKIRDPWIPHPEQRDTVPNVELYSVLVGNIPTSPSEVTSEGGFEYFGFSKREILDWQLAVTATFFNQCVPKQPGFSSSVAAVTILPDAEKLAKAWRTWYRHVKLLQRLRFIKSLIAEKCHYIEVDEDEDNVNISLGAEYCMEGGDSKVTEKDNTSPSKHAHFLDERSEKELQSEDKFQTCHDSEDNKPVCLEDSNFLGKEDSNADLNLDHQQSKLDISSHNSACSTSCRREDKHLDHRTQKEIDYFYDVLGVEIDKEKIDDSLNSFALAYGPEQTAVYSREVSHVVSGCCPRGCKEKQLRTYTLSQLEDLERTASVEVKESFNDLMNAQDNNMESVRHFSSKSDVEYQPHSFEPSKNTTIAGVHSMDNDVDPKRLLSTSSTTLKNEFETENRFSISNRSRSISNQLSFTPQGRIHLKNEVKSSFGDESLLERSPSANGTVDAGTNASIQHNKSLHLSLGESENLWRKVERTIQDDVVMKGVLKSKPRSPFSGAWKIPSIKHTFFKIYNKILSLRTRTKEKVEDFASDSTFAVVTFTSRRAAIAARHCLADGRGADRWIPVENIPVPPLADSDAFDLKTCRGCCRPVTLTLNSQQKSLRKYSARILLLMMYTFYAAPLMGLQFVISPVFLDRLMPGSEDFINAHQNLSLLLNGIIPALLKSAFFSMCPLIFKAISNYGSNAISVNQAEQIALKYYWYFMMISFYVDDYMSNIFLGYFLSVQDETFNSKDFELNDVLLVLQAIGTTLPTTISSTWINWIVVRTTITMPLQYMLHFNVFLFQWIGWKCCRRCLMGGGPGGPIPFRIYIDSGVVFMALVSITPIAPLLAPASLVYFLYCSPLLRRNLIFLYRPTFDAGGLRWPFLSEILFCSLFVAQILLGTVMVLKGALGPALLSFFAILPLYFNRRKLKKKYLKSYTDAGLLQTSQLDGCEDNSTLNTAKKRDEFRKFLVDAHKAAYVPICIAGGSTTALTAEPAIVIPDENDDPRYLREIPFADVDDDKRVSKNHEIDDPKSNVSF